VQGRDKIRFEMQDLDDQIFPFYRATLLD